MKMEEEPKNVVKNQSLLVQRQYEIIPECELLTPDEIAQEAWQFRSLLPATCSSESCIKWLVKRRLLRNRLECGTCGKPCALYTNDCWTDGKRWRCRPCNFSATIRHQSCFDRCHVPLQKMVILLYCWACDMPQFQIRRETGISASKTIVDWCKFFREECRRFLETSTPEIGGLSEDGEPKTVEIDDTNFFHKKYYRGEWRENHWIFAGIERGSGKSFIEVVEDRRAETLLPVIQRRILPGTRIISDNWEAYDDIKPHPDQKFLPSHATHCTLKEG